MNISGLFLVKLKIEGLYPEGVISKLKREEIPLFHVQKRDKKTLELCVERKYRKKVFTILEHSCYNIVKAEPFGLSRAVEWGKNRIGFFIGAILFALLCALSNLFILRIEVVGTGDYYRREVLSVLGENGVGIGRRYSDKNAAEITAQILAFENVSFCSLKKSGSVLRVEVQTSASTPTPQRGALVSPASGTVYSLTVIRGTAQVAEGDTVEKGQLLVGVNGETQEAQETVMASVQILCTFTAQISEENKEEALASCLLEIEALSSAQVQSARLTPEGDGYLLEITYLVTQSLNM